MTDKKELNKEELNKVSGGEIVNYQEHLDNGGGAVYNDGSLSIDAGTEFHGDTAGIGGGIVIDNAGPGGKKGYR